MTHGVLNEPEHAQVDESGLDVSSAEAMLCKLK